MTVHSIILFFTSFSCFDFFLKNIFKQSPSSHNIFFLFFTISSLNDNIFALIFFLFIRVLIINVLHCFYSQVNPVQKMVNLE